MSLRIFVTGAQGFIGRYLVSELLDAYSQVSIIGIGRSKRRDNFTHTITVSGAPVQAPLPAQLQASESDPRYRYLNLDIHDREGLRIILEAQRPEVIFHLASGLRDDPPADLFNTNVAGTIDLLETTHEANLEPRTIVITSSGSVYGMPPRLPVDEAAPCAPRDFYAASKLAQEHVAQIVARDRQLPVTVARIFNVVGPGQEERHVAGRFAAQLAGLAAGGPAWVEGGDLSPSRDFIDVRDVARALTAIAENGAKGETYNVASGEETPIARIVEILAAAAGVKALDVCRRYKRPSDIPRVIAAIDRLHALGYVGSIPLERSLFDVFEYYTTLTSSAIVR